MLGFDFFHAEGGGAVAPFAFAHVEAEALVARMAIQPDTARKGAIDALVGQLKAAGVWAKLDALYLLAAHDAQAARLNWIADLWALSPSGAPVFTADRGYATDGIDDALSLGVGATAFAQFQRNSATVAIWSRSNKLDLGSGTIGNAATTGARITLIPRNASGTIGSRLNSSTATGGGAVETGWGLTAVTRTSSASVQHYKDGVASGVAGSATSAALTSATLSIGSAEGTSFGENQFQMVAFGGALTAQEHAGFHAAVSAYLTALGVAPLVEARPLWASEADGLLPDGGYPYVVGKGLNGLGLARDPADGSWWIARGTGVASMTQAGVAHLSPDFATLLSEWTLTDLNATDTTGALTDLLAGSCQGIALDTSDLTLFMINKLAGQLVHFTRTGQLIGVFPIAAAANGLAYDAVRDRLVVGFTGGDIVWHNKDGTAAAGAQAKRIKLVAGMYGDQIMHEAATDRLYMSKDGTTSTDAHCELWELGWPDYPLPWRSVDATLAASRALEGIVAHGGRLHTLCDASFHGGNSGAAVRNDNHWRRHTIG